MKLVLAFEVLGKPEPAGSKQAFPFRRNDGSLGVRVADDNPKAKAWKETVAIMAKTAMRRENVTLIEGFPLSVSFEFTLERPKKHFRTGRHSDVLRPDAPDYPTSRPDALKLSRGVEDALATVVYFDDAQIVDELLTKRYGTSPGVKIRIYVMPRTKAEEYQWQFPCKLPFQF